MEKVLDYEKIGNRIKKIRVHKDVTQQELADQIDMSVSHLSNIENGNTIASLDAVSQIADVLDVCVDMFLKDSLSMDFSVEQMILADCDPYERYVIRENMIHLKKLLREQKTVKVEMKSK